MIDWDKHTNRMKQSGWRGWAWWAFYAAITVVVLSVVWGAIS